MKSAIRSSASPTEPDTDKEVQEIVDFWNQVRNYDELDATHWGVLEALERAVTEAMWQTPRDLVTAKSATAQAFAYLSQTDTL